MLRSSTWAGSCPRSFGDRGGGVAVVGEPLRTFYAHDFKIKTYGEELMVIAGIGRRGSFYFWKRGGNALGFWLG